MPLVFVRPRFSIRIRSFSRRHPLALLILLAVVSAAAYIASPSTVRAQTALPSYTLQFLGAGSPVAINNTGTIAGARLVGTAYQPLVSRGGGTWTTLPLPAGTDSAFPTDLNDAGIIVGVAFTAGNGIAVRWTPSGGSYLVDVLPRLAGDTSSYATGINNLGQIVGARRTLGYVPASSPGWLYSDTQGLVNLQAVYGLDTWPEDINDNGILISGNARLRLATGVIESLGSPQSGYALVGASAINNADMIAGIASLSSTSLNIVSAFRFVPGTGWQFIAGTSRYTTVSSINLRGDIGYGELGAGIYFDGLGSYPVWQLIDPAVSQAGWTITGSGTLVNDNRVLVTTGRNTVTGESGAVLLTPIGSVQPPAAPVLTGVAHPSTPSAPWDAISLTWTASAGASSYAVERKGPNDPAFVTLTASTIQLLYDDTAIAPNTLYTYRVFAIGVAGRSAPSNEVTVLSPTPATADTIPPVVTITSPAPHARVSGIVRVRATATDNVGVTRMELRTSGGALLASVSGGTLVYDWDTSRLRKGSTQTLVVTAWDAAGLSGRSQVSVRIAR